MVALHQCHTAFLSLLRLLLSLLHHLDMSLLTSPVLLLLQDDLADLVKITLLLSPCHLPLTTMSPLLLPCPIMLLVGLTVPIRRHPPLLQIPASVLTPWSYDNDPQSQLSVTLK